VSSILLFRFSALTYNAHRIHYDPAYAAQEGYAGLVVHGPLQALMMGESLRRAGVSLVGHEFAYRLIAPMVGEQVLTVVAAGGDSGASARVTNAAGQVTATSSSTPG
jgi:3-methylfumaryl-CoA hydratase